MALRGLVLTFGLASLALGQQTPLERIKAETTRLRAMSWPPRPVLREEVQLALERSAALRLALRDWVESLLPRRLSALPTELPVTEAAIARELSQLEVQEKSQDSEFEPGSISKLKLERLPEAPEFLLVTIGVKVPCGAAETAYIYRYSDGQQVKVLEASGPPGNAFEVMQAKVSEPDKHGDRLLLIFWLPPQCASNWMSLSYDLFRLSRSSKTAVSLLAERHGWWTGGYDNLNYRVDAGELLIQLLDQSISADAQSRFHVLRYEVGDKAVRRIDPVALQPRDFAEEWLTRPWGEMRSRTASTGRAALASLHRSFPKGSIRGYYFLDRACSGRANHWQVGIEIEERDYYFLVRETSQYRYEMVDVSTNRQPGCPGEGMQSTISPSLFPRDPRGIR